MQTNPAADYTPSLSIVVPALNEEGNIEGTLASITAAVRDLSADYEIIVVNDGSSDGTADILRRHASENPNLRVITHDRPWGFGASYHDGRAHATKAYTVMVHGDNAFDQHTLVHFFSHVGKADVICGYIANPHARTWTRRAISRAYTALLNLLFGLRLRYYNGLQIHRTDWLRSTRLGSDGFAFQAELLIKAIKGGKSYLQVPTIHVERPGGGKTKIFKVKNVVSVARTVWRLFLWQVREGMAQRPERTHA